MDGTALFLAPVAAGSHPRPGSGGVIARASRKDSGFAAGIVSAAADNDPTTVATLSIIGASTIYGLAWLVILVVPMLAAIQAIGAAVGVVSRRGLIDCVRYAHGMRWATVALVSVLFVNLLTLAADLEGGAAAVGVLVRADYRWFVLPLAAIASVLLIYGKFDSIVRVLRYVALVFAAYLVSAILARPDWRDVLLSSVAPHWQWNPAYVAGAIALLGTTLTSYAYVWQTIEMAEERPAIERLRGVQWDAAMGMVYAGVIFWSIVVCTGATLGVHHRPIETTQDAALALTPLAGHYAATLFSVGLLASAVLAIPVLTCTNGYVVAGLLGWRAGLDRPVAQARGFYRILLASLAVASLIACAGIGPIQLLFASSIAGGIGTPVTLTMLLLVAGDRRVMREYCVARPLLIAGWGVNAIVVTASLIYFVESARGGA